MLAIILSVLITSVELNEGVLLLYHVGLNTRKSESVKCLKSHLFKLSSQHDNF